MKYTLAAICLALAVSLVAVDVEAQVKPNAEASADHRESEALAKLKAEPNAVAVYAQGLCCQSCAIGVRKKVNGLDFVDLGRLEDGVALDAKTQLVTIALKKGKTLDVAALTKAIDDAGYTPVQVFTLEDGRLVTKTLAVN